MTSKRSLALTSAALAAVWLITAPWLARGLIVQAAPSSADAVILLSGSAAQTERVEHTLEVVHQGRARLVIITDDGTRGAWSRSLQKNPHPVEVARAALLAGGLPNERIIQLPGTVHSTNDEAVAAALYVRQHQLRTILIVTSAYHSRRALWVFRRVLRNDEVAVGIDPAGPSAESPEPDLWWLSVRGWRNVGLEYPKLAYYFVMHR